MGVKMNPVFKRVLDAKVAANLTWDELAQKANIAVSSWMTGLPTSQPSDAELKRIAPVLNVTYKWLKYGE